MKKMLSIVGTVAVFGVIVAVIAAIFGGGASSQFSNLRCDVEKPEGEYENAAARSRKSATRRSRAPTHM